MNITDHFLLNPEIIFLNHGSFGACPKPVFDTYQAWQRELESQPVEFLARRIEDLMAESRGALANYLNAFPDEIVYFPNPTTAANMVFRNLKLQPGDEILTTNHEYGAMDRTWHLICRLTGAIYVQQPVSLPIQSQADVIEAIWSGVNPRTRVLFISHITSPTALIFPIKELIQRARQAGIITIVDGAHAPGQISLDLHALDADYYIGACHKWLCAPKGAAFLYARRELQSQLLPLVVSWGYESTNPSTSQFIDYHEWQGTRDMSAFLSVPAAISFQAEHNWPAIRQSCHELARQTRAQINNFTGLQPICPDTQDWFLQMFTVRLPEQTNLAELKARLYAEYRIEVPMIFWEAQCMLRVSVQAYNSSEDCEALVQALQVLV